MMRSSAFAAANPYGGRCVMSMPLSRRRLIGAGVPSPAAPTLLDGQIVRPPRRDDRTGPVYVLSNRSVCSTAAPVSGGGRLSTGNSIGILSAAVVRSVAACTSDAVWINITITQTQGTGYLGAPPATGEVPCRRRRTSTGSAPAKRCQLAFVATGDETYIEIHAAAQAAPRRRRPAGLHPDPDVMARLGTGTSACRGGATPGL